MCVCVCSITSLDFFEDRVSCIQAGLKLNAAESDLELLILPSLSSECWDCRYIPPCLVYMILGTKQGLYACWVDYQLSYILAQIWLFFIHYFLFSLWVEKERRERS